MRRNYQPKEQFIERMKELLGDEFEEYWKSVQKESPRSIRANTLKITPEKLKKRLENKGWVIGQPFKEYPEIMIVEGKLANKNPEKSREKNDEKNNSVISSSAGREGEDKGVKREKLLINLEPGELGRSLEHLLGYYYVQEVASMLPVLALNPQENETVLDLCAAPGSKTSQISAKMKNKGVLIANDLKLGRIKILASNLERCGAMNTIITKKDGIALCRRLKEENFAFDKILIDAPCSGEGTIRSVPITLQMWSIKKIQSLSRLQKALLSSAVEILKVGGEIVYSTCTHAPEENEEVLDYILKKCPNIKIEKIYLPVKSREGLKKWKDKEYLEDVKYSCRIYPQDKDNTEGFFISKLKKIK
jgi:NOL1/NOP2/sun family putative RNA methylase